MQGLRELPPVRLDIHHAIIVVATIQAAEEFGQIVSFVFLTVDKAVTDSKLGV